MSFGIIKWSRHSSDRGRDMHLTDYRIERKKRRKSVRLAQAVSKEDLKRKRRQFAIKNRRCLRR